MKEGETDFLELFDVHYPPDVSAAFLLPDVCSCGGEFEVDALWYLEGAFLLIVNRSWIDEEIEMIQISHHDPKAAA